MRLPTFFNNKNGNGQTSNRWDGSLWQSEIDLAKTVFGDTLPYNKISIANIDIGSVVTVTTDPVLINANFVILWKDAFGVDATSQTNLKNTLIHELTHVWQANYGQFPMAYMAESVWAQLKAGNEEIWKDGYWEGIKKIGEIIEKGIKWEESPWHTYRSKAYEYAESDVGKNWSEFNVEQQGNIVENWFRFDDGNRSLKDNKYPYIVNNILAKSIVAQYTSLQHPSGYSDEIAKIQAKLHSLGYFTDIKEVDGLLGNRTRNAVRKFQGRNGLFVDGKLGNAQSQTRTKLNLPEVQLVRAK